MGQWASEAEDGLIDLRKAGAFRQRHVAAESKRRAKGSVGRRGFSCSHSGDGEVPTTAPERPSGPRSRSDIRPQKALRAWSKRFAQWLFSTDHIAIRYGIDYDGVDIRKLSPGTRGIVLLLLLLALDNDDRPLVIDQPIRSRSSTSWWICSSRPRRSVG